MTAYEKIVMLPPNVSKLFYFPLQGSDQLVRTGTIADGSCIFHALFHAYSSDYVHMKDDQKMELVSRLRSSMAKKMSKDKWKNMNGGVIAMVSFQEIIDKLVTKFYNVVEKGKRSTKIKSVSLKEVVDHILVNDNTRTIYSSLIQIITLKNVTAGGGILETSYKDCDDIDSCKVNILRTSEHVISKKLEKGGLEPERIAFFVEKFKMMMKSIVNEAECSAYTKYIQNLENNTTYIDQYQIDLVAEKFGFDIYFVNASNRLPYMTGSGKDVYKQRTSVLLLWVGENHYEIIGRIVKGTKRVQRQFKVDDPLIKMLYTLHCYPSKFSGKYPQFTQYLPADFRKDFGVDDIVNEDSESENESIWEGNSEGRSEDSDSDVYSDD